MGNNYQQKHSGPRQEQPYSPEADLLDKDISKLILEAEKLARGLLGVRTHQVRNFFSTIQKIRIEFTRSALVKQNAEPGLNNTQEQTQDSIAIWRQLCMLKPRLAFATGKNYELEKLKKAVDHYVARIGEVRNDPAKYSLALQNFLFFSESIVAYHKF